MATTKLKDLKHIDLPPENDEEIPKSPVGADGEDPMDSIDIRKINDIITSAEINKGGTIRIERKGPLDMGYQYLIKMPAEGFDIEVIKKMYGGGDYKCQTFRANGQMYKGFTFSIDYRFSGQLDERQIKAMSTDKGESGGVMAETMRQMVSLIAARPNQVTQDPTQYLVKMMESSSQQNNQMMAMMMMMQQESSKTMMNLMAVMMGSNNNRGQDPMMTEILRAALSKNQQPMAEMLESFKMFKELTGSEKEEKDDESMFDKVLKMAPAALQVITGGRGQPMAPQPAQAATPAPAPQNEADAKRAEVVNKVFKAASIDMDPITVYGMMQLNLDIAQIQAIKAELTGDDWSVKFFGNDPRAVQFKDWLEEFREVILNDGAAPVESSGLKNQT